MVTDMVGYAALTQIDEARALRLLETHRRLLRPIILGYGGIEIKTLGDGFLIEFGSALEAAQCAIEIQKVLRDHNQTSRGEEIAIRIGVHIGDVIHREGDVYGDAVNIASRIEPLAEPGGICVSEQVFAQLGNKINYPMAKLPPQRLKNVEFPFDLYRVVQPWEETQGFEPQLAKDSLVPHLASVRRISSGIERLDKEIGGGLPEGTITMVYGPPKTGKSLFTYHFLMESIRANEPCLFIMTDYVSDHLSFAMAGFGWDIRDALKTGVVQLVDMTSTQLEKQVEISFGSLKFVSLADPTHLMMQSTDILKVLSRRPGRFRAVLDSLTPLFIYNPPMIVAKFLRQFALKMKSSGAAGIVVTHVEGSIDPQSELMIKSSVDNLIHLRERELIIEGMLGTPKSRMAYQITGAGMKVGF